MELITCPKCHYEFELSDALTHEIEERIRQESAEQIASLKAAASEAELLKKEFDQRVGEERHRLRIELGDKSAKEKKELFETIESLQRSLGDKEADTAEAVRLAREQEREKAEAEAKGRFEEIQKLKHALSSHDEQKALAVEKAVEAAVAQTRAENETLMRKRLEDAKSEAVAAQKAELQKLQTQLEIAAQNEKRTHENFKEMLTEQSKRFDEQKEEQKTFFEKQLKAQKEMFERDAAERERSVLAKTRLEFELKQQEQAQTIDKLTSQIEQMKETAQQRSQQLQGEALEVLIEERLMRESAFRLDEFSEVKKGANGVDVNMVVKNAREESCGLIMIEAKRAANWSDKWVEKIRKDRIDSGAREAVCLIVSTRLPNPEALVYDLGEGVWATVPEYFIHFVQIMRKNLEELHKVQKSHIGREDKKEILYRYVNSDAFRSKVNQMVSYHEDIYAQGVKIQKNMKKMLDTIVKSKEMGDDIFIELGNRGNIELLPGLDDDDEPAAIGDAEHKSKELLP
jgi:hypothetical protein